MKPVALALLFLTLNLTFLSAQAQAHTSASNRLDWFGEIRLPSQVTPLIWRSGRPTQQALTDLYARGVRTIINLEDDPDVVAAEAAYAKKQGFVYYSYPTGSFWQPEDKAMNEILQILRTTHVQVLVHCYHGEDRTGLVIGLERVLLEKWQTAQAHDEMLSLGFHEILLGLDQYFWDKVGSF